MSGLLLFARPWWLAALLPVALIVWLLWRRPPYPPAWARAIDMHLLPHLLAGAAPRTRRAGLLLLAAVLAGAVFALAGPLLPGQPERTVRRDAVRALVVDLSPGSAPQLETIKAALHDLLHALPDGETALIVYAEEPYLVVPPTTDIHNIARFIPELDPGALPLPGNRPERALRMAQRLLARSTAPARDLIWVGAAADAAALPPLPDIRLSILHAGAAAPALAGYARRSGGISARVDDSGAARQLAAALSARGGWTAAGQAQRDRTDGGYWLVLALLPLAALAFRRGVLAVAGPVIGPLLCATLLAPPAGEAAELPRPLADYRAWRLFEAGSWEQAAGQFADRRWRAAASYRAGQYVQAATLLEGARDADSLYNRGNALAKQGRLVEALASYDAALAARPQDADAAFNRELVRRLLNERPPPPPPQAPPPSGSPPPAGAAQEAERDAARIAEQWLRRVPDEPATLLRRKLQLEHQRRARGDAERAW